MRSAWMAIPLALALLGCEDGLRVEGPPCSVPAAQNEPVVGEVVLRGERPLCRLSFEEVARLSGREDEPLARPPIAVAPDGRFVTATYDRGQLAVWSAEGEFERTIGRGEGAGPGEFSGVPGLSVYADTVVVFASRPRIHRYTLGGDFVETIRVPLAGSGTTSYEGRTVVSMIGRDRSSVLTDEGTRPLGPAKSAPQYPSVLRVASGHVWEAEDHRYQVRRYPIEGGEPVAVFRREVPWFPEATREQLATGIFWNHLQGLAVGESGLIWTRTQVVDVEGPPLPDVTGRQPVRMQPEDWWRYLDGRIEAFLPQGVLVASERYDDPLATPMPITADLWYLVDEDDLRRSVSILRVRLVSAN